MCSCEKDFGLKYLPHQLSFATAQETHEFVPVTIGFQQNICNSCRGVRENAYPKSQIYGRTTKISRYYWREIAFKAIPIFADWAKNQGYADWTKALMKHQDILHAIEKDVVKEIKEMHEQLPKYTYLEESQEDVLIKNNVEIVKLEGTYIKTDTGLTILDGKDLCSPEEFSARYYRRHGYEVLFTESIPFHVLFGVFFWKLIQDPSDPMQLIKSFGDRTAFETKEKGKSITTYLPQDFGSVNYGIRRSKAIEKHIAIIPKSITELIWLFDFWIEPSKDLRQYLWAHRPKDISTAHELLSIVPIDYLIKILSYLIRDYWGRYCGWPDLLVYRKNEILFVEVKSSHDKLSEDQKNWIRGNHNELHLPFKLVKIHKKV